LVISLIALFVALGGSAYAASSLPKNSVGTKQLKNNAVTEKKIAKSARGISSLQTVTGTSVNLGPDQQNEVHANCPAGTKALSGGWQGVGGNFEIERSMPTSANAGWSVVLVNNSIAASVTGYAVCAKAG
jgi:hypothetical protein